MGSSDMDLNESFQVLEEKISKAGEVFKRAVAEKRDLELTLKNLKESSSDSEKRFETLQREVQLLRREREARVEAEAAQEQMAFLARASELFAESLDYVSMPDNVVSLIESSWKNIKDASGKSVY